MQARALRVTGKPITEQTFLCLGAGEASTGIADLLASAMIAEGLDAKAARGRCWMVDSKGLVVASRNDLAVHKIPYAHEHAPADDFLSAVKALKPTAIIGAGATPGLFTEEVVKTMSKLNERPIVFALSNPTSKSECTAEQAYQWSGGRALFASGSPFDPVDLDGEHYVPRQGNNCYIFPGVGLGVVTSEAIRVTDEMFMTAARTLAELAQGSLYPPLTDIREVSARIAVAVAEVAFRADLACIERPADVEAYIRARTYQPRYLRYIA